MEQNCEECDSSENVKQFTFFDGSDDKRLCWECRKPIVMARLDERTSEEGNTNSDSEADEGTEQPTETGQTTFGSFQ